MAMFAIGAVFKAFDQTTKVINKIGNSGTRSFDKLGKSIDKTNKKMDLLTGIGKKAIAGIAGIATITALVGGMKQAVATGIEFEQTLVTAGAKFGFIKKGTQEFEQLKKVAMDIGKTTEFSASQAAEGLQFLAAAGFDAETGMKALPTIVDFATAGGIDLSKATDIATDSLGALGMMTDDATKNVENLGRIMNVAAFGAAKHNFNIEQFFETVKQSGPLIKSAGVSVEQYTAALGILADAGIKGSKSGTHLKNILTDLQSPTAAAEKQWKSMGITLTKQDGSLRDITEIFGELNQKLPTGAKRAEAITDIFGQIPLASVNILLDAGADKWNSYTKRLEDSTGAMKELANMMRDTTKGNINTLKSAVEGLGLTFFTAIAPAFNLGIKALTKIVSGIDMFLTKINKVSPLIIDVAIGVGFMAAAIVGIPLLIGAITTAWTAFTTALLINPFTPIILGVGALIGVLIYVATHWEIVKTKAVQFFQTIKPWITLALATMGPLGWMILILAKNFDKVKEIALPFLEMLAEKVSFLITFFKIWIGDTLIGLKELGATIISFVITPLITLFDLLSKLPKIGPQFESIKGDLESLQAELILSPQQAQAQATNETITTQRQTVDVNFNNAPKGTTIKGTAPNVTVNQQRTAFAGGI